MLVTDLAYRDMEARADGLVERLGGLLGRLCGRSKPEVTTDTPYAIGAEHQAHLRLVPRPEAPGSEEAADQGGDFRWRRHPQLLTTPNQPDTEEFERGARSASIRGLFLARSGRFEEARDAFSIAAEDSGLDLTAIPGFWDLSRGGMQAAVFAYEDVERFRDAAALGARIRLMYRPRSLSSIPAAPVRRRSASGS